MTDAYRSWSTRSALHSAGSPDAWTCYLLDDDEPRALQIRRRVESWGGQLIVVRGRGLPPHTCEFGIVLYGLSELQPAAMFGAQLRHERPGLLQIAYGREVNSWSLGRRAQLLLAGFSAVLDSGVPSFADELEASIREWIEGTSQREAEAGLVRQVMNRFGIVGRSPLLLDAVRQAMRAAAESDAPVLIAGETGTGKESLASVLHALDPRRSRGPLVAVNCAVMTSALADAALFGHTRGAFTGAQQSRKGLFRAAEGGVLLLDEVAELTPALQTKLLRVLQERRILPLGSDEELPVDVRVVAATSQPLAKLVDQGAFRQDLLHRLNALCISTPPLRERRGDLRPLVEHIIAQNSSGDGCPCSASDEFIVALSKLKFPGNVRQLENLVRQALLNRQRDYVLDLCDLPREALTELMETEAHGDGAASAAVRPALAATTNPGVDLALALENYERNILLELIEKTDGNQTHIARLLNVTPRTVYNKFKKHGLMAKDRCRSQPSSRGLRASGD